MKRPLVAVACLYGGGVVLGNFHDAPLGAIFPCCGLLMVLAIGLRRSLPLLLAPLLFLLGWLNMSLQMAPISPGDLRNLLGPEPELVTLRGELIEAPVERVFERSAHSLSHSLAELKVEALRKEDGRWRPASGRIPTRTLASMPPDWFPGQQVEVTGVAAAPPPPLAPELFDYARHLRQQGLFKELRVQGAADWNRLGRVVEKPLSLRFRNWAQEVLARGLPKTDESLRLQWAMILGWETALTNEVSEPFMKSGTMHIFAISGLHIALIVGIVVQLLRALTLSRRNCAWVVLPVIWFYIAATGWQPSAIRSAVMMTVILGGWLLNRPDDLLNSLAAAALLILLWQPQQLFQASFQLSFFVVLSLAMLSPPLERLRERLFQLDPMLPMELRPAWQRTALRAVPLVWTGFATSLAAFLGSLPLIAHYFHLFTPGSLVANLVVVPVSSLALMSGMAALVTGDWLPWFTELFNLSGWLWMTLMIWLSKAGASLPGAWWYVASPGPILFCTYYGALLAVCLGWFKPGPKRWGIAGVISLGLLLWLAQRWQQGRVWELTVLPLHRAHAVYLKPHHGQSAWLINTGDEGSTQFTLEPYLQAQGLNSIPRLLLTHGDSRFMGGTTRLSVRHSIGHLLVSPLGFRSSIYRNALRDLETTTAVHRVATNGAVLPPWIVLHPQATDRFPNANDNQVILSGEFDGIRVVLIPDLGLAGQNAMFERHPRLKADVLIAGCPERGEPLRSEWLETLKPKQIVLADSDSVADRPRSRKWIERLAKTGAEVVATHQAGAVTLRLSRGRYEVKAGRPVRAAGPEPERGDPDVPGE